MFQPNDALLQLFQAHRVEATLSDDGVRFPKTGRRASASVVREMPQTDGMTVQIDVFFDIAPGTRLVESFAGVGKTRAQAALEAVQNFAATTLHVLLAALLQADTVQTTKNADAEEWRIGGEMRRVFLGEAGIRGEYPAPNENAMDWFTPFQAKLCAQYLGPETHWVRLYYGHARGKTSACEVLLDNETWDEMQTEMAAFPWPVRENFYGIRLFLVIAETTPNPDTPEGAVTLLAQSAAAHPEQNDAALCQTLKTAGVSGVLADRALDFTQIAWGRVVLARMEIRFAPDYFRFDPAGNLVESGTLAQNRFFVAAARLCARYVHTPAFKRLSSASADVQVLSNAVNNGATPESLLGGRMSPPLLFTAPPTDAGLERAHQFVAERTGMGKAGKAPQAKTPWWPFRKR